MARLVEALREPGLSARVAPPGRWVDLEGERCRVYVAAAAGGAAFYAWCDDPDEWTVEAIRAGLRRAARRHHERPGGWPVGEMIRPWTSCWPRGSAGPARIGAGLLAEGLAMAESGLPHILVVDDTPEILALYRELLEGEGYRVSSATVPATDLGDVERLAPDLVVLDLVFGTEELGLRFLERLEHAAETVVLPVLVVSASHQALAAVRDRFAPLGVATLAKPFDIDDLLRIVGERVGGEQAPTETGAAGRLHPTLGRGDGVSRPSGMRTMR